MKVEFLKKFLKDIDKISKPKDKETLIKIIETVEAANGLSNIPNIKKLTGFEDAYRIRSGDYRIGVFLESDTI